MNHRRGFTLLEISIAAIVLAAVLVVCMRFFRATTAQRQSMQDRRFAIQEVDNVMERLCTRPWEELTPESVRDLPLGDDAARALPGSRLSVDVVQPDEDPNAKRITVMLRWPAGSGRPDHTARLVAWRYSQNTGLSTGDQRPAQ